MNSISWRTQEDVARRLGVTQSAYAPLEARARPRPSSRERLAKALGIGAGQLDF